MTPEARTSMDPRHAVLFEPIQIGPKRMPNRFYKAPHCTYFGSDWPATQAHFRAMAAEGGWGAVNTEYCSIHPSSDDHGHAIGARIWDNTDVRNLSLLCEMAHEHGALAGVELWYGAAHAVNYESRMPARGVSQIPSDYAFMQSCYEMDKAEIRELQNFYVAAAKRARSAGFDLINVYGGHAHPITYQFLEPYYNKRTDEYGGSFENRARFWRETLELVKAAVGDDCAVIARICLDSLREDAGITADDALAFIRLADHLVDLWDLQLGGVLTEWGEDTLASRWAPEGYQEPWIARVRPSTTKPLVGVGRYTNPDTMAGLIHAGILDIIGSARGSIADPFLPRKIQTGAVDEIRECIGCNVCAGRFNQHALMICTQNATAGEEYRRGWHPERFRRASNHASDVLVVGAGPAGMECATILGKRGMRRVHLVDAGAELGGSLQWITRLPGLGEWARVTNYRQIQIGKLKNVEFHSGMNLDANAILEYGADIVVLATGAHWATDGLSGATHDTILGADASRPNVLTPEQIMVDGKDVPPGRVLVYDCDGYFVASGLAERLAGEGREVVLVTPFTTISPYSFFTLDGPRLVRHLISLGVELVTEHVVRDIAPGVVTSAGVYTPTEPKAWEVSAIVLVTQRVSDDGLYRELAGRKADFVDAGVRGVHRIGDCVVPRLIADAIFDGHRLAREIDTDDPSQPLPFIRENRVLGSRDADYDAVLGGSSDAEASGALRAYRLGT